MIILFYILTIVLFSGIIYLVNRFIKFRFLFSILMIVAFALLSTTSLETTTVVNHVLFYSCPMLLISIAFFVFFEPPSREKKDKYFVTMPTDGRPVEIKNLKRGISIIGSAGSGKTESTVYYLLKHLGEHNFSGIIHDYKNLELTEIAHPLFAKSTTKFYVVCFDRFFQRVNPIAPEYMETEEDVNEISRVLTENLLELKDSNPTGSGKFFNDVVEGLFGGLIWILKEEFPQYCTLPHLIAVYQLLNVDNMVEFLSGNLTSKSMADAYIKGVASEKQTAGVNSTLSNALKRLSTKRIFYVLSGHDIPLDINTPENLAVVSIVNNPKYDSSYSPVIASIVHTMTKQMSVRNRESSFLMMEEASTIRLLNMARIPATMRSYDIATMYVIQDKIQNDIMYGDKGSKAILSNLSYQFFGKANDPDTAKYYESFFEIIKRQTRSVSSGSGFNFDSRVTTGEKDQSKIRAEVFFKLNAGQFVVFSDGTEKVVQFQRANIKRSLPKETIVTDAMLERNYERIHQEIADLFMPD